MRRCPCGACPLKQARIEELRREVYVLKERCSARGKMIDELQAPAPTALRPVSVSTSGGYWEGLLHRFCECGDAVGAVSTRRTFALVEGPSGTVSQVDLSCHTLKFLDRS